MKISLAHIGFTIAASFMTAGASAESQRDYTSGNYMLAHCKHSIAENFSYDAWDGECSGIISSLIFFGESFSPGNKICVPRNATRGQATRVVLAYLEQNPAQLHLNFKGLAHTALQKAWPCK